MVIRKLKTQKATSKERKVREEIKFQYFWYLVIFFTIYLISYLVPVIIFMTYVLFYFLPYFLETTNFFSLFINFKPLLALISMPLVIIGCYLIRLFFIALIARWFWGLAEKRSPSRSGIIPRNFPSRTLNYYHIKSFLMKYPKNTFTKGLFPWLLPWLYNFVKSSKIGKGTTLEESIANDRFLEIGKNCYIGVNSALATHMVDGIFGDISYFKIKIGDNVTAAATNLISAGTEIYDNSYLLPLASASKHSVVRGNGYYFSLGAQTLRKIFKRRIKNYLKIDPVSLKQLEDVEDSNINPSLESQNQTEDNYKKDLSINFTTSSTISRVNLKFLAVYLPIFFLSGFIVSILFYIYTYFVTNLYVMLLFLPAMLIIMHLTFIFGSLFFSKIFLILINLIHKPKEGIFEAEIGNNDFEFWMLRTELKKITLWLMRNWPFPWADVLAFRGFGIKMDFSSGLYDSWCDGEFIQFGRRNLIGQGTTIMSSMVVGKYLIIKKVIFGDYVLIGAQTTIAPGTIVGKESFVGAMSFTVYDQILEPGWVYFGMPVRKLKPNKYAESRRDLIVKKDVDTQKKFEVESKINIEKEKKDLI